MTTKTRLFGMEIDPVTMAEAVRRVLSWREEAAPRCHVVVTPNLDHAVMFQRRADLREVYATADLVLADGFPLVVASKLLRRKIPQRVAGSDLVPALFEASSQPGFGPSLKVFLLGAAPGVADRAALQVQQQWSGVEIVGTYSPPLGFQHDAAENDRIAELVAAAAPDVLVVGLGAPKQELWVHAMRERLQCHAALCVGATIDFLAGEKRRSPRWMQRCGLEWLHRLCSEPQRLAKRYAADALALPALFWRELFPLSPRATR